MNNLDSIMCSDAHDIVFRLSQEAVEVGYNLTMPCIVGDALIVYEHAVEHEKTSNDETMYFIVSPRTLDYTDDGVNAGEEYEYERHRCGDARLYKGVWGIWTRDTPDWRVTRIR